MRKEYCCALLLLAIACFLNSCTGDCFCTKDLGCAVVTVKKRNPAPTNIVVSTKTFCPSIDYHRSYADLQDSINAFEILYNTDSTYVEVKDSIYKHYDDVRTRHNLSRYTDSGYICNCPK